MMENTEYGGVNSFISCLTITVFAMNTDSYNLLKSDSTLIYIELVVSLQ